MTTTEIRDHLLATRMLCNMSLAAIEAYEAEMRRLRERIAELEATHQKNGQVKADA